MKPGPALLGLIGAGLLVSGLGPAAEPNVLIVTGDTDGYLSPCGCTKPMSGGLRRRLTLVRQLMAGRRAAAVESGGMVAGAGRQDQLKAEALAQALRGAGYAAVHLADAEAKMGLGGVASLLNLLDGAGLSTSLEPSERLEYRSVKEAAGFAIGGLARNPSAVASALGERARSASRTLDEILAAATASGRAPILLFQGSLEEARALPRVGEFAVVVFRSAGAPTEEPIREGETAFVSPGEKGKYVLEIHLEGARLTRFRAHPLPPDVADDPQGARIYRDYLGRVDRENLLAGVPRIGTARFAGTGTCGACHTRITREWKKTEHAHALGTLESDGHGRDPDCVGCHVIGLDVRGGFQSRAKTPSLAKVGCESCHGPGAAHSKKPWTVKMGKIGEKSCMRCHVPDHSPGFDFATYWNRIRH